MAIMASLTNDRNVWSRQRFHVMLTCVASERSNAKQSVLFVPVGDVKVFVLNEALRAAPVSELNAQVLTIVLRQHVDIFET